MEETVTGGPSSSTARGPLSLYSAPATPADTNQETPVQDNTITTPPAITEQNAPDLIKGVSLGTSFFGAIAHQDEVTQRHIWDAVFQAHWKWEHTHDTNEAKRVFIECLTDENITTASVSSTSLENAGKSDLVPASLDGQEENQPVKETDKEVFLSIIEQQPDRDRWWVALRVMAGIFAESHDTDEACRAASDYLADTAPQTCGAHSPRVIGPIESITSYKHRSSVRYINAPYVSCAVIYIVREGREEADSAALDAACAQAGLVGAAYSIGPKGGLMRVVEDDEADTESGVAAQTNEKGGVHNAN